MIRTSGCSNWYYTCTVSISWFLFSLLVSSSIWVPMESCASLIWTYIVWYCWSKPTINSIPQQGPWHSKMSDTQHQPSSLAKSVCCAESGSGAVRSYTHSLCNDVLRRSVTVERCNKCSRARFVVQLHDCSSARPHVGSESASILFEFILIQYYEITFTYSIRYVLHWTIYAIVIPILKSVKFTEIWSWWCKISSLHVFFEIINEILEIFWTCVILVQVLVFYCCQLVAVLLVGRLLEHEF